MEQLIILELLIHHLDLARFLVGEMKVVSCLLLRSGDLAGEDAALISLAATGGAIGAVAGDFRVPGTSGAVTDRVEVIGTKGRIVFDGESLKLFGVDDRLEEHRFDLATAYQAAYDGAIGHFVEKLREGSPFETNPEDNPRSLALVEAAYVMAGSRAPSSARR